MQPITATVTDLRKEAMLKFSTDYEVYTAFCTIKGETFRKEAFIDTKNPDVAAGDIIGATASIPGECADQSHLHFEIYKDGHITEPLKALGMK